MSHPPQTHGQTFCNKVSQQGLSECRQTEVVMNTPNCSHCLDVTVSSESWQKEDFSQRLYNRLTTGEIPAGSEQEVYLGYITASCSVQGYRIWGQRFILNNFQQFLLQILHCSGKFQKKQVINSLKCSTKPNRNTSVVSCFAIITPQHWPYFGLCHGNCNDLCLSHEGFCVTVSMGIPALMHR